MLLDCDMSGVKLRMGRRKGTVDLLICNARNEVQQTSQPTTADCQSFQKFSLVQRFKWINT